MATKKQVNNDYAVKTINGQRWLCERVVMTETTTNADWDFVSESDGRLWKKIRPWKADDLAEGSNLAGQDHDDK